MSSWSSYYSYKPEIESVFSASYFNTFVQNVNSKIDDFLRDAYAFLYPVSCMVG